MQVSFCFFPKQLDLQPGMLCPAPWSCLPTCLPVSQLVLQPGMLCPAPWSCVRSCLPSCLPVCQLVLQPGMLCPAPWSCVCLVSQLVSQSPSLFFSLGCCVRLPGLVSELVSQSASLFFSLGCCVRLPGLVFVLFPVLSLNLSPSLPACSSAWDAVSGSLVLCLSCLPVSQLFFSLGCCVRLPGLVFVLSPNLSPSLPACSSAWDAVSGSLVLCQVLSPILSSSWCLWSGLVSRIFCAICATVWGLRWCNFLTGDELESESKVAPLTLLGMPLGYSLFLDCSSEGITQSQNKFHESRQQTSRCYPKGPLRDTNMKDRCY